MYTYLLVLYVSEVDLFLHHLLQVEGDLVVRLFFLFQHFGVYRGFIDEILSFLLYLPVVFIEHFCEGFLCFISNLNVKASVNKAFRVQFNHWKVFP